MLQHFSFLVFTGSLVARLAKGKDECSGRVEVRHGDTWQTVCDAGWTQSKAETVCTLLECGRALTTPGVAQFGQGNGSVVEASDSCFDNVTSLEKCSKTGFRASTCSHERDAAAVCAGKAGTISIISFCNFTKKNAYLIIRTMISIYNWMEILKRLFSSFKVMFSGKFNSN